MAVDTAELRELIEAPSERPEVEYKAWLDLSDPVARAKTAKHLCALSNYGGGYLVYGINDDRTRAAQHPGKLDGYNHNVIAAIVEAYLEPAIHCDVLMVQVADGKEYPVIRVPPHGRVPICGKKNGPQGDKGKIEGIKKGVHYTRVPGPRSVPVESAELWRAIIHRAVLAESDTMLASISRIFRGTPTAVALAENSPKEKALLMSWHEANRARFLRLLNESGHEWPVPLHKNHYELSLIIREGPNSHTMHNLQSFREILRVAVETVRQDVWTGWSMFHQFETDGIAPYIQIDETTGCEVEVLETNHLGKTKFSTTLPDFWRVALDGRATIIRPYREDRRNDRALRPGFEAGTWLSPDLFIRDIYEFVTFARHLVKSFHGAGIVEFLCTWWGLEARRIADPNKDWRPGVSRVDSRSASAIVQPEELPGEVARVTAALAAPVLRLFDGLDPDPDYVRNIAPGFRVLPIGTE